MFGLSKIQLGIMAGLGILCVVLFGMWQFKSAQYDTEKQAHTATKLEYANYVEDSEQRVKKLKQESAKAQAEADALLKKAQAEAQRKSKDNERLIRENETLKSRTVSNDFVSVFNDPNSEPITGVEEHKAAEGTTPGIVVKAGAVGEHTEEEVALVLNRNKERFERMQATILGWQTWAKAVCETAGCEP